MSRHNYRIINDIAQKKTAATSQFWKFTAAAGEGGEAELILYGDIAQRSWWNDSITPQKFSDELAALGNISALKIRINSGGGDVFAATAIYNRMIDLRNKGVKVTAVIDGWAASAATLICMAAESITISDTGVFMIHNPKVGICDYFEAKDLEKLVSELNTVKTAMIAAYVAKTGKTAEDISAYLDAETWLDGASAVEEGFCTELVKLNVTTTENSGRLVVNAVDMGDIDHIPVKIAAKLGSRKASAENNTEAVPQAAQPVGAINNSEENENMTLDELKAKYPDLVDKIKSEERKRIQDIEDAAVPGFEKIVQDAKFTNPVAAGDLALLICSEQKKLGADFLSKAREDAENSGVNGVEGSSAPNADAKAAEEKQFKDDLDAVYGATK